MNLGESKEGEERRKRKVRDERVALGNLDIVGEPGKDWERNEPENGFTVERVMRQDPFWH